jgi:hypothetical protein
MMPVQTFEHTPPIDWAAVEEARKKRGASYRMLAFELERLRADGSVQVLATSRARS